jgi:regulator of nucleoside diphosphate kinase
MMENTTPPTAHLITDQNRQRLGNVIDEARRCGVAPPDVLMLLEEKLELARCVPPTDIPDDVVTMNSKFRLRDLRTNELQTCVLCYPESIGLSNGYLSVLDPIGFALLGRRAGDVIIAKGPSGVRQLQLVEVLY